MISEKTDKILKIAITGTIVIALILGIVLVINFMNSSKQDINEPQSTEEIIPDIIQNEPPKDINAPVKNIEPADKESVPKSDFKVPEIG